MKTWLKKHKISKGDAFIVAYIIVKCILLTCMIFYKTPIYWYLFVIQFTLLACNTIMYTLNPVWAAYIRSPFLWNYESHAKPIGNYFSVDTATEMESVPTEILHSGMMIYVKDEHRLYVFNEEDNKFLEVTEI